jgi:hypothetical protein
LQQAKIQARIITRDLTDADIDGLAVVAVAGEIPVLQLQQA